MNKFIFFKKIEKIAQLFEKLLMPIVVILGWGMFLVVIYAVFQRYFLRNPIRWGVELSQFMMVWLALLSGVICELKDEHVYITFILNKLPFTLRRAIKIILYIFVIYFFYIIFRESFAMIARAAGQRAPGLRISMRYPLMIVPIVSLLYIIALIIRIILCFSPENYTIKTYGQKEGKENIY